MRFLAPLAALSLLSPALAVTGDCLRHADHSIINARFTEGGPGTKVYLCPGVEYALQGTIVFTAADQELATAGYASGDNRATLRIDSERVATAIQGDCRRCARVAVRNLIIDGARRTLGRVRDASTSPGLIIIGGNTGQAVRECAITDPRGFTAVHVREGAKLNCRSAVIERNEISSVGEEYDKEYDGADPESSPWGRPLADGISIACRDSVVRDNVLTDCTDAGIVVYCSPGSRIENNRVTTEHRSAIGGILLVDATPFGGDYTGVVVRDNVLDAKARAMRVGIGLGLSILSDDIETTLKGGSVVGNRLTGDYMGYGIAAAGLVDWTIKDNLDDARYEGEPTERCFDEPVNPHPQAFIYNSATLEKSDVQDGFFDSDFAYIVCIDGVGEAPVRYSGMPGVVAPSAPSTPGPADSEGGISAADEFNPTEYGDNLDISEAWRETHKSADDLPGGFQSTGSSMLDGILMYSQQRLLDRIGEISSGLRTSMGPATGQGIVERVAVQDDTSDTAPSFNTRLTDLEASQAWLLSATRDLHITLKMLRIKIHDVGLWEGDVLLSIQQEVEAANGGGSSGVLRGKPERESEEDMDEDLGDDDFDFDYDAGPLDWAVRLILLGGFCSIVALLVRRYRGRPTRGKLL